MYDLVHTDTDILKERYIFGSELTDLGFPRLPRVEELVPEDIDPTPINLARTNLHPQRSLCHFFVDDSKFEPLWNQPHKQLDTLRNFKFVCSPDFSCWGSMPLPVQLYNKYRIHALSWHLLMNDINVIPTATWNNDASFSWCFDGMPKHSVIAIGSNGIPKNNCKGYLAGIDKMIELLEPIQIVNVGQKIELDVDVPVLYLDGYSQQMRKRG